MRYDIIKKSDGSILRPDEARQLAPGLPNVLDTSVDMSPFGLTWARVEDRPTTNPTEVALKDNIAVQIGGEWVIGWEVRAKTVDELLKEVPWSDVDEAKLALSGWIDALTFQIEGKYPRIIRAAWAEEEAAALAYKLGTETDEQRSELIALGSKKGRTADEHADRVLALAGQFRAIKGHVHALWLETDAALEQAGSPLEYPTIFETAQQTAAPLAAAYGLST